MVLSGGWTADGISVEVPHTWNAVDAADGAAKRYGHAGESVRSDSYLRKRVVYRRALPDGDGQKAFVRVNGASQTAVVSVNGCALFTHRGAFTPFVVDVTAAMKPTGNVLEIAVDNFVNPDIPPVHADFSLFGGLYRSVEFFRGSVPVLPPTKPWPLPERIRGVNRHQDFAGKGWAISSEDEARDVALMKEMGVNLVRTAHYPTSDNFYSLCDRAGIAVISEASAVDFVTDSAAFRTNYLNEIREMVAAFAHHPCIVAWGLFNEMASDEKVAAPIIAEGAKLLRALDPSRPVYGVADIWNVGKRELQANVDLLGFNLYPGWYAGSATDIVENVDRCFAQSGCQTGFIAEYGAGGSPRHHDLSGERPGASYVRFHPEEYQALVHEIEYRAIQADARLRGGIVWCFADFASDVRNEGDAPGINDKGLVTYDRGTKKDTFYFYQANWTQTPVLHVVGSRAETVALDVADLRVYSNVGDVSLSVNGRDFGMRAVDDVKVAVFKDVRFNPGENTVVVRAGTRETRWTVRGVHLERAYGSLYR